MGAIGVTGTGAANALAEEADVVLAVGTRLQDFTTGSWALFKNPDRRIIGLNVQAFDAGQARRAAAGRRCAGRARGARPRARRLDGAATPGRQRRASEKARWIDRRRRATREPTNAELPSDAQVIGAVQRAAQPSDIVVCAAGGLPGELHKLWKAGAAAAATTWNTAIPAWATRSPAASA